VSISNSKLWLYIGLLLAGTLAASVKAQTPDSETVPDLETNSATVLSSLTANESQGVTEALTKSQELPADKVQLPPEKTSQAFHESAESVNQHVDLADLTQNSETPVEESITAASALSQSNPGVSFNDRVSVKLDNLQELVGSSEALQPSAASVTSEQSSKTSVELHYDERDALKLLSLLLAELLRDLLSPRGDRIRKNSYRQHGGSV